MNLARTTQRVSLRLQRGAVSLITALAILVALSLVTMVGARIAMVGTRVSANNVRSGAALAAADAGMQAALSYVVANKNLVTSTTAGGWMSSGGSVMKWANCTTSNTAPPCGDGRQNLYGTGWQSYGPIPNLPTLPGEYQYQAWYVSNTLSSDPANPPFPGCLSLPLNNLVPVTGPLTSAVLTSVNSLLSGLSSLLFSLLGLSTPLSLNTAPCLPINFSNGPTPPPSKINPSLVVVVRASSASDTVGAVANAHVTLQRTSLFNHAPLAGIMANGIVDMTGDIRVWGNPRPPTVVPNDFSLLNLNNVAGLNVTSLLGTQISAQQNTLAPLLGVTVPQLLALNANVTFPLSIWSQSAVTLHAEPSQINGGLLSILLLGQTVPNPNVLNGARTCLPQWDGTANSACSVLSQSVQIAQGSVAPSTTTGGQCITWVLLSCAVRAPVVVTAANPPNDVSLQLKLPDIQDPQNLASTITGLLSTNPSPTFPSDLLDYTFGYPVAQAASLQAAATVLSDCTSLGSGSSGLYWVTGNCVLTGTVGQSGGSGVSATPVAIVVAGNVSFAAGSLVSGVVYMHGGGAKTVTGAAGIRATLRGSLLVDGNLTMTQPLNVVYDQANIRAAGFLAGSFAPLPGSWNDAWSAP